MKKLLTITALVLAMTVGANAAQLSAGPIYSHNGYYAYCWFTNLGNANITPTLQVMYAWYSTTVLSTYTSCATNSAVVPGQSCYISANTAPLTGASCKVVLSTSGGARGSLELTDEYQNELSQVELR